MKQTEATIITIGDELLIGQTIDTNSAFIAQELNRIGVWVKRRVAIADDRSAILQTLADEAASASIIIITGGLGPTADDITKPALCGYFNTGMREDAGALQNVTMIFEKLGRPLTDRNIAQAQVPANCEVLQNARGTAPGMWFFEGGVAYASLPGVPHEMKGLMHSGVIPKIKETFSLPVVQHKTLLTAGIGESFLADKLADFEASLPPQIKMAYLPAYGMVRLRLTSRTAELGDSAETLSAYFETLKTTAAEHLVADEDISIQEATLRLLKERGKTLATAESCTGGTIAHMLTLIPGASVVYKGSVVSYANSAKESLLNVPAEMLKTHGAVSEETVLQMATSATKIFDTDYAVATSGVMGPDGGSDEKPVGTVWIAIAARDGRTKAQRFQFRFDRGRNIELTTHTAFNFLRRFVVEGEGA